MWQYAKCGATRVNEFKVNKNLDMTHWNLVKFLCTFLFVLYSLKLQSICMQLWITLTRWPHLSVYLKSTFIQMCSARWRLTLHNPSKCSVWSEGLVLLESSESSLAYGEAADIRGEAVESFHPGNKKKQKKNGKLCWYEITPLINCSHFSPSELSAFLKCVFQQYTVNIVLYASGDKKGHCEP